MTFCSLTLCTLYFHARDWWPFFTLTLCTVWFQARDWRLLFTDTVLHVPMLGTDDILFTKRVHCSFARDWWHSVHCHCAQHISMARIQLYISWHCSAYFHARTDDNLFIDTVHCMFPYQGLMTLCLLTLKCMFSCQGLTTFCSLTLCTAGSNVFFKLLWILKARPGWDNHYFICVEAAVDWPLLVITAWGSGEQRWEK